MLDKEQIESLLRKTGGNLGAAARLVGMPRSTLRDQVARIKRGDDTVESLSGDPVVNVSSDTKDCVLTLRTKTIRTLEDALAEGHVDLDTWEVERWVLNKWDCVARITTGAQETRKEHLEATELWQVKVWFKRKAPEIRSLELLLESIEKSAPRLPKIDRVKTKTGNRRMLEISLVDPHLGLQCYPPESQATWGLDECERAAVWAIETLLQMASAYMPVEEIVFPFGNDFLHCDNVFGTTTAGTGQPEALSWHHVYLRGEELAIGLVNRLREVAKVKVYEVPGNHARHTEFTLGRVLRAYYRNDKDVEVDASPSPYKFHSYGANLIGFEHGHSIQPIRMAAIMANECPEAWAQSTYREWHLADQHRKGTAKPSSMEEQGVSIEYLPSLVPGNAWHTLKGFSHQRRSCMAFIWDYVLGPVARLQVNLDSMPMQKARR